jgi:hypothetical protein
MKEVDYIRNTLNQAILHINFMLNDEHTTKSFDTINQLNAAKEKVNSALNNIITIIYREL